MKLFSIITGALASLLCLFAGIWLLTAVGFDHSDDAIWTAIGIYFIAKAFFVGPLLILTSVKSKT